MKIYVNVGSPINDYRVCLRFWDDLERAYAVSFNGLLERDPGWDGDEDRFLPRKMWWRIPT